VKLLFNKRGWFFVIEWLSGTKDYRTGVVYPDRYGCFKQRIIVGPYENAESAMRGTAP
jgi:hypothetical protein